MDARTIVAAGPRYTVERLTLSPEREAELLRIDRDCFPQPLTELSLRHLLTIRGVRLLGVGFGRPLLDGGGLYGYVLACKRTGRLEILRLGVLRIARRHGLGRGLLLGAMLLAKVAELPQVMAEVDERDEDAVRFFAGCGLGFRGEPLRAGPGRPRPLVQFTAPIRRPAVAP